MSLVDVTDKKGHKCGDARHVVCNPCLARLFGGAAAGVRPGLGLHGRVSSSGR